MYRYDFHYVRKWFYDDTLIREITNDIFEVVDVPVVLSDEWHDVFLDKIPVIINEFLEMHICNYMTDIHKTVNKYGVITLVKDLREEFPDFEINFDDYEDDIYISLMYHLLYWYFTEYIEDILDEWADDIQSSSVEDIETRLENYFYEFLNYYVE